MRDALTIQGNHRGKEEKGNATGQPDNACFVVDVICSVYAHRLLRRQPSISCRCCLRYMMSHEMRRITPGYRVQAELRRDGLVPAAGSAYARDGLERWVRQSAAEKNRGGNWDERFVVALPGMLVYK